MLQNNVPKGGLRMEIYGAAESVKSREDLIEFINQLRMDLKNNKNEWNNITLEDYLNAMESFVNDMYEHYLETNQILPKQPSWENIALTLLASSMY